MIGFALISTILLLISSNYFKYEKKIFLVKNDQYYKQIENNLKQLERIVHVDLKGAQPKAAYFKEFFKLIKDFGATGILLEYEDVFPYNGKSLNINHIYKFYFKLSWLITFKIERSTRRGSQQKRLHNGGNTVH